MAKKTKNPSQSMLTEEEERIIHQVILTWGMMYTEFRAKYNTPKDFARKLISLANSRKAITSIYLLLYPKKSKSEDLVFPSGFNKELANIMLDQQDETDITVYLEGSSSSDRRYIDSSDMTKILRTLEAAGIYINIKGKKEIRHIVGKKLLRGKPKAADKTYDDFGGKPSAYKTTELVEKLKITMSKPETCRRLRTTLVDSGIIYSYLKFILEALYHAAKVDATVVKKLFRLYMPAEFINGPEFKTLLKNLLSIDERDLEKVSAEGAKIAVENQTYDGYFFVAGLLNLNKLNSFA
jgi:hypothetical protein